MNHVPPERAQLTLITGFLGAGKTTLINRLLQLPRLSRAAIIVNEFGEMPIDGALIRGNGAVVELANGCLCCAAPGQLVEAIDEVLRQRPTTEHILVETSGLASPGPILRSLRDQGFSRRVNVGSVVTAVDARRAAPDKPDESVFDEQIRFASQIVFTKTDVATERERALTATYVRMRNPLARATQTPSDDASAALFLESTLNGIAPASPCMEHHAAHADGVESISIAEHSPVDPIKVTEWLESVVREKSGPLLRGKGFLNVNGEDRRIVFHIVQDWLDGERGAPWGPQEKRVSRLVFIGRNLDRQKLTRDFAQTRAGG